jgi:F0F1-type ATP synthase membrane subunit a
MRLLGVAVLVFLLNIPFGYWRAGVGKFSWQWILSIHLPVPIVILLRIFSGLGWQLISFPVLIGAFFLGQFCGGKLRSLLNGKPQS